jgi:hypothetical protein
MFTCQEPRRLGGLRKLRVTTDTLKQFLCGDSGVVIVGDDFDDQAGRSKHWVKVKNRRHPAMDRVMEAFR